MKKNVFFVYSNLNRNIKMILEQAIYPSINQFGWSLWDLDTINIGDTLYDKIVANIRKADLLIFDLTYKTPNVLYELGLAHAWGKPTIIISNDLEKVPFDIASKYEVILYSPAYDDINSLNKKLESSFHNISEEVKTLWTPAINRYVIKNNSISIEFLDRDISSLSAFNQANDIINVLNQIEQLDESFLTEIKVGSFGAWLEANIKSVAELLEKIIFFIPELKKKKSERLKIDAETRLINSKADYIDSKTEEQRRDSNRKDVEKLFDLLSNSNNCSKKRITIGNQLRIESDENGNINIGNPIE